MPLWESAAGARDDVEPAPRTGVAVIGAGYTGLSAALALGERGVEVTVLEADRVGFGASGRNGGMVLTGLKLAPQTLIERYGPDRARSTFSASLDAIALVESIVSRHAIDCKFVRCGHLELAAKKRHAKEFVHQASLLRHRFGHDVRVLVREELADEIGSDAYFGAILDERSASVDPGAYARGLADAATRHGARICERTRVERVERHARSWHLHTNRGDLRAEHVVVATGAYTSGGNLARRFVPLGSYSIATAPLAEDLAASLLPHERMAYDSMRLLHYFRLTPDRRMLFGGRAAFLPEAVSETLRSARILREDMIRIFPALAGVDVDYAWGGNLDVTFDLMPHAAHDDGAHYAIGYAGHGIALATLLGASLATAIVEGKAPGPFASPAPRAPIPFYNGRPWFLPLVGAWERLMDVLS